MATMKINVATVTASRVSGSVSTYSSNNRADGNPSMVVKQPDPPVMEPNCSSSPSSARLMHPVEIKRAPTGRAIDPPGEVAGKLTENVAFLAAADSEQESTKQSGKDETKQSGVAPDKVPFAELKKKVAPVQGQINKQNRYWVYSCTMTVTTTTDGGRTWQKVPFEIDGEKFFSLPMQGSLCNLTNRKTGVKSTGIKFVFGGDASLQCVFNVDDGFGAKFTTPNASLLLRVHAGWLMGEYFGCDAKIKLCSVDLGLLKQFHSDILVVSLSSGLASLKWATVQNMNAIGSNLQVALEKLFTKCGTKYAMERSQGLAEQYAVQITVLRIQSRFTEAYLNKGDKLATYFDSMNNIKAVYASQNEKNAFKFTVHAGATKKHDYLFAILNSFAHELGTSFV